MSSLAHPPLKVLDLFAGLGGWSTAFRRRGDDVLTLDSEPWFEPDICVDIMTWNPDSLPWTPDVVLASPPCEAFSIASAAHHWNRDEGGALLPATRGARKSIDIIRRTFEVIVDIRAPVAVVENPRGMLRSLDLLPEHHREQVWLCHYGSKLAKPTDLWGLPFPEAWSPKPECHNGNIHHGEHCCCKDHISAARNSTAGTQGVGHRTGDAERSKLPFGLGASIREVIVSQQSPVVRR